MDVFDFDPTRPLAGPPDPWEGSDTPSRRDGPPYHMTDMIAAEPFIAERILAAGAAPDSGAALLAAEVRTAVSAGAPVVTTGCGTSEHGALAVAEILSEALGTRVVAHQAFELSLDPPSSGLVIGISHEGGTTATNAALKAARTAGARTAIMTASSRSPGAALADVVAETRELDTSWCHTVGYLSPIVGGAAVAGVLIGRPVDPAVGRALVAGGDAVAIGAAAEAIAHGLAGASRILVLGSGADRIAGRELTLKIEEGTWLPAAYRDLETFLHGHLAATDPSTAVVAIATDRRASAARTERLAGALRAARVIGMPTAAIVSASVDTTLPPELTSLGRIVVPDAPVDVPASVASLLSTAVPLQTLTERLARARGVDPDPIHRDVDAYREAADAAG